MSHHERCQRLREHLAMSHLTVEDGGAAAVHGAEDGATLDQRSTEGTVALKK